MRFRTPTRPVLAFAVAAVALAVGVSTAIGPPALALSTTAIDKSGVARTDHWTSVAAGMLHNCGTRDDGTLWCWGFNGYGGLGDGTTTDRARPVQAGADTTWASVTAGTFHTCGIQTDGTLRCWGANDVGQLGDGTGVQRLAPTQIGDAENWVAVSADGFHTCGLRSDNSLWCWGANFDGQVGDGTTTDRLSPVKIGGMDWITVSSGGRHTCATRADTTLWCWGRNRAGQVGDGTGSRRTTPVRVGGAADWSSVSGGSSHTCATRTDGSLWCWGSNKYGQVGDGTRNDNRLSPVQVGSDTDWANVSGATWHTCGVRTDQTLWCWGWNRDQQLADPTHAKVRKNPFHVGSSDDWVAATGGRSHSCGVRASGLLLCWGENIFYQLGDGTSDSRPDPKPVRIP